MSASIQCQRCGNWSDDPTIFTWIDMKPYCCTPRTKPFESTATALDLPSAFDRLLAKAHRFTELARDETTDQSRRHRLTHIVELIAVEMEELRP